MLPLYVYARGFAVALFGIGLLQLVFRSVLIGRPADLLENDIFAAAVAYPVSITLFAVAVQLFLGNVTRWLFGGVTIFLFVYSGLSNLFAVVYHIDYGAAHFFRKVDHAGLGHLVPLHRDSRLAGSRISVQRGPHMHGPVSRHQWCSTFPVL